MDSGRLADIVGAPHLLTEPDDVAPYVVDWTGRFRGSSTTVARPGSLEEVVGLVAAARDEGWAIVPQGGNTGLVGGSVPLAGELVVSLGRLASVAIDGDDVVAGAGATVGAVQAVAASAGKRYAVDLAARDSATVGGTVATNAGGLNVVRYGRTDAQIVALEAVAGTGERCTDLDLCGSEGTLGIVTGARVRLVPAAAEHTVALIGLASVAAAVGAVAPLRTSLADLEAAELFLADGLDLVCRAFSLPRPFAAGAPAYLLVEVASVRDATTAVADAIASLPHVVDAVVASAAARRASLWRYREDHTLAINTLGPPHKLDVGVPLDALETFIDEVPARVAAVVPDARTWLFGHVAVGNVHVNVTGVDPSDERIDDAVLTYVVSLGGSISAEHGIGTAKRRWAHLAWSAAELDALRARKRALDPSGIMNPNVRLPPP